MSDESDDDRTHDPTPQRREKFRKEGQIARSRDAGAVAAVLGAGAAIAGTRGALASAYTDLFTATIGDAGAMVRGDLASAYATLGRAAFWSVVPPLIAACLAGSVVGFAQAGFHLELDRVAPKPERLDPRSKLGELFSPKRALSETTLAVAKVFLVGIVAYRALMAELPTLLSLTRMPLRSAAEPIAAAAVHIALHALAAAGVVAGADYAWSRFQLEKRLKMTLKELKDEMRQEDGDPKTKARMRARARRLAKRRMMTDVKNAAVVVTNPTHVAVALRYDAGDPAPIVVAKGHDEVALAIRREARKAGIPIVESRALARTLDADVRIGEPARAEHFAAVAKVLAFVYALRGRRANPRPTSANGVARRVQPPRA